ncbi:hypothetical protein Tco_0815181, partial [Tanacetum coccineum]
MDSEASSSSGLEPKNYKDALTQACWIEAMQEELNEFKRLEVWELIPRSDKVMVITLKWIYKVKLDELGGMSKNRTRVVARDEVHLEVCNLLGDRLVSWSSKRQKSAVISCMEAEYVALSGCCAQLAYIFTKALGRERIEFLINKLPDAEVFRAETLKQLAHEAEKKFKGLVFADSEIEANFLRSMKGGFRIEGDEITIYKKVTRIKTSNQFDVTEIAELEVSEEEFLEINESIYFNQEGSKAFLE